MSEFRLAEAEPGASELRSDGAFQALLQALQAAHVRHALLRDDPHALDALSDLDLLVHPDDVAAAFAVLNEAGFRVKRDRRLWRKWVFVRYRAGRFDVVDLHGACIQNGFEYMDAALALERAEKNAGIPCLAREDAFVHLLLHNLIGKGHLQAKHLGRLRALQAAGLDPGRLRAQTARFGLGAIVDRARSEFEVLSTDAAACRALRATVCRVLWRQPRSAWGALRFRYGGLLRLRRRAVVFALLGPDGSGKTSFADALQAQLEDTPFRPGRVYMGSWGHDLLPMRQARRLVPPQVSHTRLLLRRLGAPVGLSAEERARLERRPNPFGLAAAAVRYAFKGAGFHTAIAAEMTYRYVRHIVRCRRPIVISDRWVHDLEFRQGKVPFVHGQRARAVWYRVFPAPDAILYLTTPYDLVEKRKPQLDRRQFEIMDAMFRTVLAPQHPLLLVSDAPPDEMVRSFLTQHWERILERVNRRA